MHPSYPQGNRVRDLSVTGTAVAEREKPETTRRELENLSVKHSGKKNGSKRLRRSLRLGSTEDEETSELPLTSMTPKSQIPIPGSGVQQGKLQRSLRKTVSDNTNSNMEETGSPVSIMEVKDKQSSAGGGRMEKKKKFTTSFPRRQWSWRSKKTDFDHELSSREEHHSRQRSSSDLGDGRRRSSHSPRKENTIIAETEATFPTSLTHSVADSWSRPTPNNAFLKHTTM